MTQRELNKAEPADDKSYEDLANERLLRIEELKEMVCTYADHLDDCKEDLKQQYMNNQMLEKDFEKTKILL